MRLQRAMLLGLAVLGLLAAPLAAEAQPAGRVGLLLRADQVIE